MAKESEHRQRLSKALSAAGVASRRACEELIFAGRVTVNGQVVLVPQTLVDLRTDNIAVSGEPVIGTQPLVYYVLNKPVGYVCTQARRNNERLVLDLFTDTNERLFTIGRLDKETEGLILVTNDGDFANKVIHPSSNIVKEYLAKVDLDITHEHLVAISNGTLVDGVNVQPASVRKVRRNTLKIVVGEGKKHEVRLLLQSAGLKVHELTRIRLGGLVLGKLPVGGYRRLTERERRLIFE